ncbi:MAG: hypothetical protein GXO76_05090 [Calditrichaeota bacterium]|nr:hypothetical protein [Calditrichota bacterium]
MAWILLLSLLCFSAKSSFAQLTLITNVKYVSGETEDILDFTTTSTVHAVKKVFPRTQSILIQLVHTEFMPDSEERFVNIVKRCFLRPNVAQLSDGTIFILFKGISASKIRVVEGRHRLRFRILKRSPQTAYLDNFRKGVTLVKKKKYQAALIHLRRALRYRPGDAAAYFWAGKARFALGDWKAARFNLEQARHAPSFARESGQLLAFIQAKQAKPSGIKRPANIFRDANSASAAKSPSRVAAKEEVSRAENAAAASPDSLKAAAVVIKRSTAQRISTNPPVKTAGGVTLRSENSLEGNASSGSIQLILFLTILVLLVSLPFLWLWNRRVTRRKLVQAAEPFEKNLETFQVRQQHLLRQFEAEKNKAMVETDSVLKNPAVSPPPRPKKGPVPSDEPLIRNHYSENEIVKKTKRFASRGYTYDEIAQKLGMGKGELQLIMNLAGETIEMAQKSGMRLTFAEDR